MLHWRNMSPGQKGGTEQMERKKYISLFGFWIIVLRELTTNMANIFSI